MQFSFVLTRLDWKVFLKLANRRIADLTKANSKLFAANFVTCILIGFAVAAYVAMYRKHPELTHDLNVVAYAIAAGLILFVANSFYREYLFQAACLSEAGSFLATQTVDADENAIEIKSYFGTHKYPWVSFIHRSEDDKFVYLFMDNALALILPKSAIGSPENLTQLRGWAGLAVPALAM